jgi:holo-[acyl-carrier protein] synthase
VIRGLGIDVVSIDRIRAAMENPRFLERILTEKERQTTLTPERVAGRWAAKEALSKALPQLNNWHDVEVFNDGEGAPFAVLGEGVSLQPGMNLLLSISHESGYAAAVAIVESPDGVLTAT